MNASEQRDTQTNTIIQNNNYRWWRRRLSSVKVEGGTSGSLLKGLPSRLKLCRTVAQGKDTGFEPPFHHVRANPSNSQWELIPKQRSSKIKGSMLYKQLDNQHGESAVEYQVEQSTQGRSARRPWTDYWPVLSEQLYNDNQRGFVGGPTRGQWQGTHHLIAINYLMLYYLKMWGRSSRYIHTVHFWFCPLYNERVTVYVSVLLFRKLHYCCCHSPTCL